MVEVAIAYLDVLTLLFMSDDLAALNKSFERWLKVGGRRSKSTIASYTDSNKMFIRFLEANDQPITLDSLTKDLIIDWCIHLGDNYSPATYLTRYCGLRQFCNWLVSEDIIAESPMRSIPSPHVPEKSIPIIQETDIERILKLFKRRSKGFVGNRNFAIVNVLRDTGLRASEICNLNMSNLFLDSKLMRVVGKGSKVRTVPFTDRTALAIDRYLRIRTKHRYSHLEYVWLSNRGRFTVKALQAMLDRTAKDLGMPHIHPHMFRHTFVHNYLSNGGQERSVVKLAGWANASQLNRYGAYLAEERAIAEYRRINGD